MLKSTSLLLALLSVAFGMLAPAHAMTSEVPKSKQTVLGKYITA